VNTGAPKGFTVHTPLVAPVIQLYCDSQFYWWTKPGENIDRPQVKIISHSIRVMVYCYKITFIRQVSGKPYHTHFNGRIHQEQNRTKKYQL